MIVRTELDFAPFYRATIGFDRVFDALEAVAAQATGYPPYNIEKTGEDSYRIVMAVAGFSDTELNVTQKESELLVTGHAAPGADEGKEYLYRGIAGRDFERRFQLAEHVRVVGASLANGLLGIELRREIPEAKRARAIPIELSAETPRITRQ
jgi:molecular chaperone IbpA